MPWHVRPRGWSWDCSHQRLGFTGEFYVWCNLSQDSTLFSKNWFGPNFQTFQLQPEGFLHSMLLQVIASQPSSWAPVTVHPTVGVDKNQEQHGAIAN